ncbi:protein odr-4 homolog [Frankliniella occidentalis]|uniref:Protein odr-4 homolog n=1 Tax=Frankliniella occidentalis TaxID=133901 RepID=A0A6J1SEA5_FRAOC|nr:protein odr-4 homolog [Frankliniella occidentalis]
MGKVAVADEQLWTYCKQYNPSKGYVIGLIIGQPSQAADYIVHLARIPPPDIHNNTKCEDSDEKLKDVSGLPLSEIKESWVAAQALDVTRMLPGGIWVLGLFLIGSADCFENQQSSSRLRTILRHVHSELKKNPSLYGDSPSEKLLLHMNFQKNVIACRSVDVNGSAAFRQMEWKFQKSPVVWTQIETILDLNYVKYLSKTDTSKQLKNQLQVILDPVSDQINNSICTLSNELLEPEEQVDSIFKKRKGKTHKKSKGLTEDEPKSITANLYMPMTGADLKPSSDMEVNNAYGSMYFTGGPVSRVFVHQKATVEEACKAVKQDFIRSLTSRLQMHADSLVEDEPSPLEDLETVHEPPRRVMIKLPFTSVTFSDYLFPGEGPEEALVSSKDLLDLTLELEDVETDLEVHSESATEQWSNQQTDGFSSDLTTTEEKGNYGIFLALGAFLVCLIAYLIQMNR